MLGTTDRLDSHDCVISPDSPLTDVAYRGRMTQDEVIEYVTRELKGTLVVVASEENGAPEVAWGDTFFNYDPDDITPPEKRFPYARRNVG